MRYPARVSGSEVDCLGSPDRENHPDLAERCLQEALYFVPGPFLDVIQTSTSQVRIAAVLRLLRDRADQVPELEELSHRLSESDDSETRGFAKEILSRRGSSGRQGSAGILIDERCEIAYVRIASGEFQMGSNRISDWERPVHEIAMSQDFLISKYPVTNSQYRRYLEGTNESVKKPQFWTTEDTISQSNRRWGKLA